MSFLYFILSGKSCVTSFYDLFYKRKGKVEGGMGRGGGREGDG